ncbi:MAG: hypothetical protein HYU60_07460 [Magnetospirillum sp.]|nr:hypothetical protein [Magnetospirillum sp.]
MTYRKETPTFVLMGNHKYYHLLSVNIGCIRAVYPDAPILVYDWGDERYRPKFGAEAAASDVTVIDWGTAIRDTAELESQIDFGRQVDLAIRHNARFQRSWRQRLRKKILKTLPGSALARPLIRAGLVFENMIAQKIPCMADASKRIGGRRMIFLDADAFILKDVDDVMSRDDFDVAVTLMGNPCFDFNNCSVINSGVIFFGDRCGRRDAFLGEWLAACAGCNEWLREQTSMVRLLEAGDKAVFTEYTLVDVPMAGQHVSVLSLPQRVYNNSDHQCLSSGTIPRVVHFANTAQNDKYLEELKKQLREVVGHLSDTLVK